MKNGSLWYIYFPLLSFCLGTEEAKVVSEITRHVFNIQQYFFGASSKIFLENKKKKEIMKTFDRLTSKTFVIVS